MKIKKDRMKVESLVFKDSVLVRWRTKNK